MTSPAGADAAGARNRAAVERLEHQALPSVRAAVYAVLADILADLPTSGLVVPVADAVTAVARAGWRTAVDAITSWVRDTFRRLLTRAVDNVPDDVAPDVPAATVEERVTELLDDVVVKLESVPDTISARVATTLRDGYDAGDTPQELRQRVAQVLARDEWDDEVVRIARTTTTTVYNAAHTAAANELERSLGEPLRRMWLCVTGDAEVKALNVRAVARRHYEGPAVNVVTASGRSLTVTPEHRVLTGRGWVAAQELHESDHLVQVVGVDAPISPYVEGHPPRIGQVVDALMESEPVQVWPMGHRVNLDGDGVSDQIEVVATSGDLVKDLEPSGPQRVRDLMLTPADMLAHLAVLGAGDPTTGDRSLREPAPVRAECPAGRVADPREDGGAVGVGHVGNAHLASGRLVADGHLVRTKDVDDLGARTAELGCNRGDGHPGRVRGDDLPLGEVDAATGGGSLGLGGAGLVDRLGSGEETSRCVGGGQQFAAFAEPSADGFGADVAECGGDLTRRLTGSVARDEIVNVNRVRISTHVYDLSTESGWFCANGLVIHNSTQDTRTRPTHEKAHAQVIESGERFRVGEALLRFPGDPLGPPEEVILCRCTVVPVVDDMVIDLAHRVAGREADVLDNTDDTDDSAPVAAARQVTDEVIDEYSDEYAVDEEDVPGVTADDDDTGEDTDEDGERWPVDPDEWPDADEAALEALSRIPPQLREYWTRGEGAAKIRWGTEGSFRRCQRALAEYVSPAQLDGLCANLYHAATGRWPGANRGGSADTPCPCEDLTDDQAATAAAVLDDPDWREKLAAALDIPVWMLGPREEFIQHAAAEAVESVAGASLDDARSGAMVALVPSEQDAERLAVDGDAAIPPGELHVTLAFLGDGDDWVDTDQGAHLMAIVERLAAATAPITGVLWQRGMTGGDDPVAMYLVGDDSGRLDALHTDLLAAGGDVIPDQHSPYVPHISTRYGSDDLTGMDHIGTEVRFDRLRVSYKTDATDFPLTAPGPLPDDDGDEVPGPEIEEDDMPDENATAAAVTAAAGVQMVALATAVAADSIVAQAAANAPEKPPAEWFRPVRVDGPTPPTVTAQGRVWGHIGQSVNADGSPRCHVGITDECVPIPPTRTSYGAFHRGEIETAEGDMVAVGYLYAGCDHSDTRMDMDEARDHLDSSCTRTAAGRVYDTEWGPFFVGSVVAGARPENVAALWKLSGEWFTAPLELHAAVAVTDAGFPVDGTGETVRVADADPEPLTAAAGVCGCPAGDACPCTPVTADTGDNGADSGEPLAAADTPADQPDDDPDTDPDGDTSEDTSRDTSEDVNDDEDEDGGPVNAVAAIDEYRARAARRTADPVVQLAAHRQARRKVGNYKRRG